MTSMLIQFPCGTSSFLVISLLLLNIYASALIQSDAEILSASEAASRRRSEERSDDVTRWGLPAAPQSSGERTDDVTRWGLPDGLVEIGKLFKYSLIQQDETVGSNPNSAPQIYYQIADEDVKNLPSWLFWNKETNTLEGVAMPDHQGQLVNVRVTPARSAERNEAVTSSVESFTLKVVDSVDSASEMLRFKDSSKQEMKPILCDAISSTTRATLLVDINVSDLQAKHRVDLLTNLSAYLKLPVAVFKVLPGGNQPSWQADALVAGPGDTIAAKNSPGSAVQWIVGCGNVVTSHMKILELLESTAGNGLLGKAVGQGILGWHITNTRGISHRRARRQVYLYPRPTATPVPSFPHPTGYPVSTRIHPGYSRPHPEDLPWSVWLRPQLEILITTKSVDSKPTKLTKDPSVISSSISSTMIQPTRTADVHMPSKTKAYSPSVIESSTRGIETSKAKDPLFIEPSVEYIRTTVVAPTASLPDLSRIPSAIYPTPGLSTKYSNTDESFTKSKFTTKRKDRPRTKTKWTKKVPLVTKSVTEQPLTTVHITELVTTYPQSDIYSISPDGTTERYYPEGTDGSSRTGPAWSTAGLDGLLIQPDHTALFSQTDAVHVYPKMTTLRLDTGDPKAYPEQTAVHSHTAGLDTHSDIRTIYPYTDGSVIHPHATDRYPYTDGSMVHPHATDTYPHTDGSMVHPHATDRYPYTDGSMVHPHATHKHTEGSVVHPHGTTVTYTEGSIIYPHPTHGDRDIDKSKSELETNTSYSHSDGSTLRPHETSRYPYTDGPLVYPDRATKSTDIYESLVHPDRTEEYSSTDKVTAVTPQATHYPYTDGTMIYPEGTRKYPYTDEAMIYPEETRIYPHTDGSMVYPKGTRKYPHTDGTVVYLEGTRKYPHTDGSMVYPEGTRKYPDKDKSMIYPEETRKYPHTDGLMVYPEGTRKYPHTGGSFVHSESTNKYPSTDIYQPERTKVYPQTDGPMIYPDRTITDTLSEETMFKSEKTTTYPPIDGSMIQPDRTAQHHYTDGQWHHPDWSFVDATIKRPEAGLTTVVSATVIPDRMPDSSTELSHSQEIEPSSRVDMHGEFPHTLPSIVTSSFVLTSKHSTTVQPGGTVHQEWQTSAIIGEHSTMTAYPSTDHKRPYSTVINYQTSVLLPSIATQSQEKSSSVIFVATSLSSHPMTSTLIHPSPTQILTTVMQSVTTEQTSPRISSESELMDSSPKLANPLPKLHLKAGELLWFKIPKYTFIDEEDGSTENLKLLPLMYEDHTTVRPNSWIKLNESSQTLYGMPLADHSGIYKFLVAAIDKESRIVESPLEITVRKSSKADKMNHEFSVKLDTDYSKFYYDLNTRLAVLNQLARAFGDSDASKITVTGTSEGSVVIRWTNNTLPLDPCPHDAIKALRDMMLLPDGSLNQTFVRALDPYEVISAEGETLGVCKLTPEFEEPAEPARKELPASNYLLYIIIAIIIFLILVLVIITLCIVCYKRNRDRTEKQDYEDKLGGANKGIPIIFADELDEQSGVIDEIDDVATPGSTLKSAKSNRNSDPISIVPPPEYPRSKPGSASSTLRSDWKAPLLSEHEDIADEDFERIHVENKNKRFDEGEGTRSSRNREINDADTLPAR